MSRAPYDGVVLTCPVTVPYVRYAQETAHWWIARGLKGALDAAGMVPGDVDGLSVSSFTLFPDTPVGLTQHLGLTLRWLDTVPMGGASGVVAFRRAARAVQAGDVDVVACVAGDANHIDSFRRLLSSFSRFSQDATYPYGFGGPNATFALLMDAYMAEYGATRADFGRIAVSQRANALKNPHALMKSPLTLEQYLDARPIADPIALFDCVMPCAGAEAFLVMAPERARDLGLPHVLLRGAIERHNAYSSDPVMVCGGWAMDRDDLYAQAAIQPRDIGVMQTYDDYPVIVMMQFEDLGFCAKGEGPDFVRSHDLTHAGDFPQNTSGGQLSCGQAGAAGGFIGMTETIRQLTGQAGARGVADARYGLVGGFGMVTYDRCLCTGAAILEAAA